MTDFCTIEGRHLAKGLRLICGVVERRNTVRVLGLARLTLTDDGLRVEGTNLDMLATIHLDVIDGAGAWSVLIDPRRLSRISTAAGSAPLKIEPYEVAQEAAKGETAPPLRFVRLSAGDAVYEVLASIAPTDFPVETFGERGALLEEFGNGQLTDLLGKVATAISTEETRYYLNGVFWERAGAVQRFVATDGHRLLLRRYSATGGKEISHIIPRGAVQVLQRFFAGTDVKVFETQKPGTLEFVARGATLFAKMIDGTFPQVDRVIPAVDSIAHRITIKAEVLAAAVRQCGALGAELGRAMTFADAGGLALQQKDPDFGRVTVETGADWPDGLKPFAINRRYASDMLTLCSGDLQICLSGEGQPILFNDGDASMTRVLMPMRA